MAKNNNESDMIERSKLVPHKCLACEASAKGKGKGVGNKNGGGGQGRKEGRGGSACNQSPQRRKMLIGRDMSRKAANYSLAVRLASVCFKIT